MAPEIVDQYVDALDAAAPGLLTGLYLTGSIALDDYRPGISDVDAVAVMSRDPTASDLDALRTLHEVTLPAVPHVDAVYLTVDAFARQPSDAEVAPHSLQRAFQAADQCFQLSPVTWTELARYGVTVRGPKPSELGVTSDAAALDAWVRSNLVSYWGRDNARTRAMLAEVPDDTPLPQTDMLSWIVLGPPRLHYTIATGDIASKTAAGQWAAGRFPDFGDLIERALRLRRGEQLSATIADAKRATDLTDAVIADALATPARSAS